MNPQLAVYSATTSDAPATAMQLSAVRLNELGNLSVQNAIENGGRLSAMFGVRSAQSNPIEAAAIGSMDRSAAPGNAQASGLAGALAAILANLAHVTPK